MRSISETAPGGGGGRIGVGGASAVVLWNDIIFTPTAAAELVAVLPAGTSTDVVAPVEGAAAATLLDVFSAEFRSVSENKSHLNDHRNCGVDVVVVTASL